MLFCEMLWEGVPVFVRRFDRTGFHPAFTSVQGAPAAVPKPVSSEPEVAVDRHVIRGQVATACGLGLTQLNHVDKIHIVPDDRRVAEALRDLLLAEGFQSEITDSVPPNACAAIVMSGLSEITSLD